MQRVAELVKHRRHFVEGQERRLARGRLRDVQMVRDDRLGAQQVRLRHRCVHPRPPALRRSRVEVDQEQPKRRPVGVAHFEDSHVRMVDRQLEPLLEGETVEFGRGVEHAVSEHRVQLEIGPELRLVERVPGGAHLLRIVRPVPGGELEVRAFRRDHLLQIGRLTPRVRHGRRRQAGEPLSDGLDGLGGLLLENVYRVGRVPEHRGPLSAEPCHPCHVAPVVELRALTTARQ